MGRASQIFWFLNADRIPTGVERLSTYTKINPDSTELKALRRAFLRSKRALGGRETNVESFSGQPPDRHWDGKPFCEACEGQPAPGQFIQTNLFVVPATGLYWFLK